MIGSERFVVIIAPERDVHAIAVACEIERLGGARPVILDSSAFPGFWELSLDISAGGATCYSIKAGELVIKDSAIAGAWYRRPYPHQVVCESPIVRRFCRSESRALFESWAHELGQRLINPRSAEIRANHKPVQLCASARVGLSVPATSMTNDAGAVKRLRRHAGEVVFKTFTPINAPVLLRTRAFPENLDADLDRLRYAPAIFQSRVPKRCEIRVTIVDEEVFPIELHPHHPAAQLDWRTDPSIEIRPHELPGEVRAKLLCLMRELGLRFGAIDLALTPDGEYVFFEVNPSGQFLFAEIHGGAPVCAALARALTAPPVRGDMRAAEA